VPPFPRHARAHVLPNPRGGGRRCYPLPPNLLLPRRGHGPDAVGTWRVIAAGGTGQKLRFSVLAPFHAAARRGDPRLPHPPRARCTHESIQTPSSPRARIAHHAAGPWDLTRARRSHRGRCSSSGYRPCPGGPCSRPPPLHPHVRTRQAPSQPGRALQRLRGQSLASAKENSLCRQGTARFLRGNWSVLFPRGSPTV